MSHVQCEHCNKLVLEADATFEEYPGATLAFCPDCIEPPLSEQYGVRP